MGWTSERKETLRRMWLEGVTSRKISEALGDVSRNAVMGMVNRMGLMGSSDHNRKLAGRLHGASNAEYRAMKAQVAAGLEAGQDGAPPTPEPAAMEIPSPGTVSARISSPNGNAPKAGTVPADPEVSVTAVKVEAVETALAPEVATAFEAESPVLARDAKVSVSADSEPVTQAESPGVADADSVPVKQPSESAKSVPVAEADVPKASASPASIPLDAAKAADRKSAAEGRPLGVSQHQAAPERAAPSRKPVSVAAVAKSAAKPRPASNDSDLLMRKSRPFAGPLSRPAAPPAAKSPGMGAVRVATDGSRPNDWRTVVTLVEEVTGFAYDPKRKGHRAALVSIATMLSRGDPRRILVPFLSEPQVISMMRPLAENGIIIGGKTPEAWLDPELGDTTFMIDMMVAEGVLDAKTRKLQMAEAA